MSETERDQHGARSIAHAGLPRERAFVLQLTADSDPQRGRLAGRLVHVTSGDAARFDDLETLLRLLARSGVPPDGGPPGGEHTEER